MSGISLELTCSQEAMSRQHELRSDLHFTVGVMLESREVGLVFIGVHLFPVSVVSCGEKDRKRWGRGQNRSTDVKIKKSCL